MGNRISGFCWEKQSGVVLWYGLIYSAIRPFSTTYWPIVFGLRIACLFLLPRRYWFALIVGEAIPLTYFNMECLNDFGIAWVISNSVPPIALGMPVVWWFHDKSKLFPSRNLVDIKLLTCFTLVLSALWACSKYGVFLLEKWPNAANPAYFAPLFSYFITYYITLLAVVPWIVLYRLNSWKDPAHHSSLQAFWKSPLVQDMPMALITLAVLALLHHFVTEPVQPAVAMALFLPAVWLTFKHGWKASVLGGTLSLVCTALLLKWRMDFSIPQQTQLLLMAIAITSLYVFGARISAQSRQHALAQDSARETQSVAQSALVFGEQRLQQTSQALECVAGILSLDHAHVLEHYVPGPEQAEYEKQAMHLQQQVHRLAENIHPSAWRQRGLAAALDETIGHALEDADIAYFCQTPGRGLRFLSMALQTALYRTACELVTRLSTSPACACIHLDIRMGLRDNVRWVMLRMRSLESNTNVANATLNALERERIAPKLGASMKTFDDLRRLARIFGGELRRRPAARGVRVTVLLRDQTSCTTQQTIRETTNQLWVG
jgi:glucose-6-phosphate-specific signal transduction histidine kinase